MLGIVAVIVTGVDGGRSPEDAPLAPWPDKSVIWAGLALFTLIVIATVIRVRRRTAVATRPGNP